MKGSENCMIDGAMKRRFIRRIGEAALTALLAFSAARAFAQPAACEGPGCGRTDSLCEGPGCGMTPLPRCEGPGCGKTAPERGRLERAAAQLSALQKVLAGDKPLLPEQRAALLADLQQLVESGKTVYGGASQTEKDFVRMSHASLRAAKMDAGSKGVSGGRRLGPLLSVTLRQLFFLREPSAQAAKRPSPVSEFLKSADGRRLYQEVLEDGGKSESSSPSSAPCSDPGCELIQLPEAGEAGAPAPTQEAPAQEKKAEEKHPDILLFDASFPKGDKAIVKAIEDAAGRAHLNEYFGIFFHAYFKDEEAGKRYAIMQNVTGFTYKVTRKKGFKAVLEDYSDRWYVDRQAPYLTYEPDPKVPAERKMLVSGDAPKIYADDDPGNLTEKVGLFRTAVVDRERLDKPIIAYTWLLEQKLAVGEGGKSAGTAKVTPIWFSSLSDKKETVWMIGEKPGFKFRMNEKAEDILQNMAEKRKTSYTDQAQFEQALKKLRKALAEETEKERK